MNVSIFTTYQTEAENEGLHFAGFIKPLEKALKSVDLGYLQAVVFEIEGNGNFSSVTTAAGQPLQMGTFPIIWTGSIQINVTAFA